MQFETLYKTDDSSLIIVQHTENPGPHHTNRGLKMPYKALLLLGSCLKSGNALFKRRMRHEKFSKITSVNAESLNHATLFGYR